MINPPKENDMTTTAQPQRPAAVARYQLNPHPVPCRPVSC
jgi:hypothetical protein